MHEASERNFFIINFEDGTADIIESDISQEGFDSFYDEANTTGRGELDNITDYLVYALREKGFYADYVPNRYQYQWYN